MKKNIVIIFFFCYVLTNAQQFQLPDTILSQLAISKKNISIDLVASRIYPHNPQKTIYVIPIITKEEEYYYEFDAYIVIANTDTGEIYSKMYEEQIWISDAVRLTGVSIDTAKYYITDHNRAFGIKTSYTGSSKPNPYSRQDISLYIEEDKQLINIIKKYEMYGYGGEWDTVCDGFSIATDKILIMSPHITNGFHDIKVSITSTRKDTTLQGEDCTETKTVEHGMSLLKYDGRKYIIQQ